MPQTMCMLLFVGVVFNLIAVHYIATSKCTEHLQVLTGAGVRRGLELGGTFKTSSFKLRASSDDVTDKRLVSEFLGPPSDLAEWLKTRAPSERGLVVNFVAPTPPVRLSLILYQLLHRLWYTAYRLLSSWQLSLLAHYSSTSRSSRPC